MSVSTILDLLTVDTRRVLGGQLSVSGLFASVKVHVFEVEGMDVAGEIAQQGQAEVDQEIGAAASDHEDAYWWDWKGWVSGLEMGMMGEGELTEDGDDYD